MKKLLIPSVHYNAFVPPAAKFWPKVPPKKARNRNKAKFATKLCKLRRDCVIMNNEE